MQENSQRYTIPGTVTRFGGSEVIISSGIPSLDELLGDGIPTGSLVIIDEDAQALYSRVLLKYFLAEGVVNKHRLYVASQDVAADKLIHQLPMLIQTKPVEITESTVPTSKAKMKIAFRYDTLPTEVKESNQKFGHYYDLSGVMSLNHLNDCKISIWDDSKYIKISTFQNWKYYSLLNSVKLELTALETENNVLRIGVYSLGSPIWHISNKIDVDTVLKDLSLFLYSLRMMVQSTKAVAFVTIPVHLFDAFKRCLHLSDIYIRLQSFSGTELGENKYLADYHGFIYVDKLTAKNTFKSKFVDATEHVFKLRRKKFVIEVLHLPPDIETSGKERMSTTSGCGTVTKLIDF